MIIKILSYNIRFGGVGREENIANVIKALSPDLVIFQEAIVPEVIRRISALAALPFWTSQTGHSIAYSSRVNISHSEWHAPRGSAHPYLEMVLAESGAHIFGLHLRAMLSKWGERRRVKEIKALLENIKDHQHGFHILIGDFNSLAPGELLNTRKMPAWIRTMVWLSGRDIQRETIKTLLDLGYVDGYRFFHEHEAGYTFPSTDPHIRFDYLFLPKSYVSRLKSCEVITSLKGVEKSSDHLPLLVEIDV